MNPTTYRLCLLFGLLLLGRAPAYAQDDPLVGLWQTQDKDAVIAFSVCEEGALCGRFYWLQDDSAEHPSLDERNKDPALRTRPLCGMTFMHGFKNNGSGQYEGGWLYSPRHSATFSANIRMIGANTIDLRGYVLTPLLGESQEWHRLAHSPSCAGMAAH